MTNERAPATDEPRGDAKGEEEGSLALIHRRLFDDGASRAIPRAQAAGHVLDVVVPKHLQRHHRERAAMSARAVENDRRGFVRRQLVEILDERANGDVERTFDLAVRGDLARFAQFLHALLRIGWASRAQVDAT